LPTFQSPIEILTNETLPAVTDPFIFEFYANPPKAESLTNNGHSITFTLKEESEITYPKVISRQKFWRFRSQSYVETFLSIC
jgi:hypothetical protein